MKHSVCSKARGIRRKRATDRKRAKSSLLSYPAAAILFSASIVTMIAAPSGGYATGAAFASTIDESRLETEFDGKLDPRLARSPLPVKLTTIPMSMERTVRDPAYAHTELVMMTQSIPTSENVIRNRVVNSALRHLGEPYRWGGTTPGGFDCSGFVQYVFRTEGILLDRPMRVMFENTPEIDREALLPGDLVFFRNTDHVGIYIGDGKFVHASSGARSVTVTELDSRYYAMRYIGSGRVL